MMIDMSITPAEEATVHVFHETVNRTTAATKRLRIARLRTGEVWRMQIKHGVTHVQRLLRNRTEFRVRAERMLRVSKMSQHALKGRIVNLWMMRQNNRFDVQRRADVDAQPIGSTKDAEERRVC
jgi:hypothetical protein